MNLFDMNDQLTVADERLRHIAETSDRFEMRSAAVLCLGQATILLCDQNREMLLMSVKMNGSSW